MLGSIVFIAFGTDLINPSAFFQSPGYPIDFKAPAQHPETEPSVSLSMPTVLQALAVGFEAKDFSEWQTRTGFALPCLDTPLSPFT